MSSSLRPDFTLCPGNFSTERGTTRRSCGTAL